MNRHASDLRLGAFVMVFAAGGAMWTAPARAQTLPVVIPAVSDPLFNGLTIPATAPSIGMWSPSRSWPLVALHLAVLPDGQVLSYGTPLGQGVQDGRTFDRWDPLSTGSGHTTIGNSTNIDSFCSAGILQTGGAMLVSGGDSNATSANLSRNSTVFNYTVNTATTQSSTLANDRWYPSLIRLADGRSLITGGADPYDIDAYQNPSANLSGQISMTPEVLDPGLRVEHAGRRQQPGCVRSRLQSMVVSAQLGRAQRSGLRASRPKNGGTWIPPAAAASPAPATSRPATTTTPAPTSGPRRPRSCTTWVESCRSAATAPRTSRRPTPASLRPPSTSTTALR